MPENLRKPMYYIPTSILSLIKNYSVYNLIKFEQEQTIENTDIKNVNYIIYHQSNKFIMDYLTEKLQYPQERVPYSLQEYGNTSCLSIPITIASALKNKTAEDKKKVILCGYGVGLSWATALVDISDSYISEILEI